MRLPLVVCYYSLADHINKDYINHFSETIARSLQNSSRIDFQLGILIAQHQHERSTIVSFVKCKRRRIE